MEPEFLKDDEWEDLLYAMHARQVIPVVGPGLVTIPDPTTGAMVPIRQALAPALAAKLQLADPQRFAALTWNDVAREYLLLGGERKRIYYRLGSLLDKLEAPPPPALHALAGITDFDFYVCSTPDPLLSRALEARAGFLPETHVFRFHPTNACDIPTNLTGPILHHVLGDYQTQPDFAVWEEDYIEYICGLLEKAPTLRELFSRFQRQHLLLLGAPSEDWVVRFLLRVARQHRLSEQRGSIYLADNVDQLGEPMVFFFDRALKATRMIDGAPTLFVEELARRWRERYQGTRQAGDFLSTLPEQFVRDSVFISYSRDNIDAVLPFAESLHAAGVPVWLDKSRLELGDNYERRLEHAIKHECSFFVSLISRATESDGSRFVHVEREWAATRHVDGYAFYYPVVLDLPDGVEPAREPQRTAHIHRHRLTPDTLPKLTQRLLRGVQDLRRGDRPRN